MEFIEVDYDKGQIDCPFCGKTTYETSFKDGEEPTLTKCSHVLLIATAEGLEYCSRKVSKKQLQEKANEEGWEAAIKQLDYPKAVCVASYVPAPSFFGLYIAYAPQKVMEEMVFLNLPGPEQPNAKMSGGELLHGFLCDIYNSTTEVRTQVDKLCLKWNIQYRQTKSKR